MGDPHWWNCLHFAFARWIRRGGYFIMRWSKNKKGIPHFLHADDGDLDHVDSIRHYCPENPNKNPWAIWKALRFSGRVKYCDRAECPANDHRCEKCQWQKKS